MKRFNLRRAWDKLPRLIPATCFKALLDEAACHKNNATIYNLQSQANQLEIDRLKVVVQRQLESLKLKEEIIVEMEKQRFALISQINSIRKIIQ